MGLDPSLDRIISFFSFEGIPLSSSSFGEGHIHQTYLVQTSTKKYILQRINTNIFPNPASLMGNFQKISRHLEPKIRLRGGNPSRECLSVILTKDGASWVQDSPHAWRMFSYIEGSVCFQNPENPDLFTKAGVAYGRFASDLSDLNPADFYVPLPGFHDTPARFFQLTTAIREDVAGRRKSVEKEIAFAQNHEWLCHGIAEDLQDGRLPLRITHNDTKLNNVLFDEKSLEPLAVIDWDTIMPGTLCHDFGDAIRFGCNTAREDEPAVNNVHFSLPMFQAFARGYFLETAHFLSRSETERMALGALTITLENGLRFLTDYLQGDRYYQIRRPRHNLDRCRTQFRMVEEMLLCRNQMEKIVLESLHPLC